METMSINNNEKLKVCIIVPTHGDGGGAAIVLEHLLRAWKSSKIVLTIVAPENSRLERVSKELGFKHIVLPSKGYGIIDNLKAIQKIYNKIIDCDLIHAWAANVFHSSLWLSKKLNLPITGTLHDHPNPFIRAGFPNGWYFIIKKLFIKSLVMKFAANHFNRLICVSNVLKAACIKYGYICPIETIYNGLNDYNFYKNNSNNIHIGFLGMASKSKGFAIVADWIEKTSSKKVIWSLYGNIAPSLKDKVDAIKKKYNNGINILSQQDPENIFSEIDILVHTSTNFDSFPTVILEAMRAGIPVIASSLGGSVESVLHDKTGYLFDTSKPADGLDKLEILINDDKLRIKLSKNAMEEFKKRFKSKQMAMAYESFWLKQIK